MQQVVKIGLLTPALLMVVSGCATKNWVREHVGKTETTIGERITTVDSRVAQEGQRLDKVEVRVTEEAKRVEGMGFRMTGLETAVTETGETAKAARSRADAAFTRADEVDGRLTRLWSKRHASDLVERVDVQFAFDRADLSDGAQTALLGLVKELKANPNLTVQLEGYADPTGPRDYNVALSQRRVEAVRRFLIEQGAELPRIHAIGMGPVNEKGGDRAKMRRVTVKLMVAAE
jgi:OOP family OmpA-OmpF porin